MPFARHSGYSFSPVSVRQNAPAWGGIFGLSNARGWVYINATDNIQAALMDLLRDRVADSVLRSATGFTFELCDPSQREERCSRLIQELHPEVNLRAT